jgi:L-lactate dehydrogenase complex protein LldG
VASASARDAILSALRAAQPPTAAHPGVPAPAPLPADPQGQFLEAVKAVGATGLRVPDVAALRAALDRLAAELQATRIVVAAPGAGEGTVALASLPDPHALEGIDLAVLPGAFGVVENGAVWVDTRPLRHRGVFVVAQHLALVVPASEVVPDMHAAYARIDLSGPGLRLFIAGPSKTADIEQALVIGAHGARSCTVVLVG